MKSRHLSVPFSKRDLADLRAGELVLLSGTLFTLRDAGHKRLLAARDKGELTVDMKGQVIYYCGPAMDREDLVINSAGPTTASRMDPYTRDMLDLGVVGFVGKGPRGEETRRLLASRGAVAFSALGGTGALLALHVTKQETLAFGDLATESLKRFTVQDFPVVVVHDSVGGNAYSHLG